MPETNSERAVVVEPSVLPVTESPRRAARFLAWSLGLGGLLFIAGITHWYEVIAVGSPYGELLPSALVPLVLFLMLVLVLALNPFLHRRAPAWHLRRPELLLVLGLWLVASVATYSNLAELGVESAGTAFNAQQQQTLTKRMGLTKYLNPNLFLPAPATGNFYFGAGEGTERIPFGKVPWQLWWRPMLFWVPLLVIMVVLSASLVRTLHRQWSRHELLTYPLANVAEALLGTEPGRAYPAVCYQRAFWAGVGLTALLYTVNGLAAYFPLMIKIPLQYYDIDLIKNFPFLSKYCGSEAYSLFRGMVFPFLVAIAVLLPTDVSLTCWLGWVLMVLGTGFYFLVTGENIGGTETDFIRIGMYVAVLGLILFIGRREYWNILRCAAGRRDPDEAVRAAAGACRVFAVSCLGLAGLLVYAGLDCLTAATLVAAFSLMVVLIARLTAEVGLPWLSTFGGQATLFPLKLLGAAALGPHSLAVLAAVGGALDMVTTNTAAAQQTTWGKLTEDLPRRQRPNLSLQVGLLVALVAGIGAILWDNYSYGARRDQSMPGGGDGWVTRMQHASQDASRLQIEGLTQATGLARLKLIRVEPKFWRFFLYGAAVIIGCAALRLRFSWWPLHPLPFLLFNTWCLSRLYVCFFLGWVIKTAIVQIGGGRVFTKSKPFFIGVIYGEVLVCGIWAVVGTIYHLVTGNTAPSMGIWL
jgi:hypothetical protein